MMSEEKTRVDFNAPRSLVERADRAADLLDISRTQLLIDALQDELAELTDNDEFRNRLEQAYYDGRADYQTIEDLLGTEAAMRVKLLRDSIDRAPPEPVLDDELPSDDEFYEGKLHISAKCTGLALSALLQTIAIEFFSKDLSHILATVTAKDVQTTSRQNGERAQPRSSLGYSFDRIHADFPELANNDLEVQQEGLLFHVLEVPPEFLLWVSTFRAIHLR